MFRHILQVKHEHQLLLLVHRYMIVVLMVYCVYWLNGIFSNDCFTLMTFMKDLQHFIMFETYIRAPVLPGIDKMKIVITFI